MLTWAIVSLICLALFVSALMGLYSGIHDHVANSRKARAELQAVREQCQAERDSLNRMQSVIQSEVKSLLNQNSIGYQPEHASDYAAILKNRIQANMSYRYITFDHPPELESYTYEIDSFKSFNSKEKRLGDEYEIFVANAYEKDGWDVIKHGLEKGTADLGCDLIATKEGSELALIIQCKRHKRDRIIHENVILQLYGTAATIQLLNQFRLVQPVLICTHYPSETAQKLATLLKIRIQIIPDPKSRRHHSNYPEIL